ncbi:MerR family transcriptional regulator [Carbonactinospora thermoautotrophica]|uniref:MerR family transcriptional regulator n=1 Tax=Carbonactinospora thermoautotrophica TaxID=1469144 RepID=UPI0008352E84|nr:MerR family transcriptional regulator [Carbonactinospora thermoautotrophica]
MRISELSQRTGVPVPTIKYYLREGLLAPGTATARNQAEYGDEHVQRLRLIRVLLDIGGLSIATVRKVLDAIADERLPLHDLLGVAHHALGPRPVHPENDDDVRAARAEVDEFLAGLGWRVRPDAPARHALADALVALRRVGWRVDARALVPYAEAADRLARCELESIPADASRADTVRSVVIGTVVYEAVLVALRRLAEEHHSAEKFAPRRPAEDRRQGACG